MSSRRYLVLAASIVFASACIDRTVPPIESPRDLIVAMRSAYDGRWYETLTFTQETIQYRGADADTSIWYEALKLPGRLRIDIAPTDSGNGLLFADDHRYVFRSGQLVFDRQEIHPLLLLGFDVYLSHVDSTIARLDSLGIDMGVMTEDVWGGRDAYVVGDTSADANSGRFWIDRERLLFLRLVQPVSPGGETLDIRFTDYEPAGGGWIAPTVEFYRDTTLFLLERYRDIRTNRALKDELFDPAAWGAATHWLSTDTSAADDAGE